MTTTTFSPTTSLAGTKHLVRAVLFVLTVLAVAAVAYVVGHETTGSIHVVRNLTPAAYWPQVSCHTGVPC